MFGRDLICEHSLLFLKFQKPPEEEKKNHQQQDKHATVMAPCSKETNPILQLLTMIRFAHLGYRITAFQSQKTLQSLTNLLFK